MKRKTIIAFATALCLLGLSACANQEDKQLAEETQTERETQRNEERETTSLKETEQAQTNAQSSLTEEDTSKESEAKASESGRILIAYFSLPEDVDTSGVDAVSGASVVVQDGAVSGNTEFVANIVGETIGGDIFRIETTKEYPLDHDPLVEQAAEEQNENLRPELKSHIEDMGQYDTVILGYPNWWADLPMPVYAFLEEYDFSGKTIIPFVTHGGSGFSNTKNTILNLCPDAEVSDNTLSLSRGNVADSEEEIRQWVQSLGEEK